MRCRYCGRWDTFLPGVRVHDAECPVLMPENMDDWEVGYVLGRSRHDYTQDASPAERMGWRMGDSALDEAENGVAW
jgi:hypothetical protein